MIDALTEIRDAAGLSRELTPWMPRCRSPQRPVDLSDNRKPASTREPIQCLLHHLANVAIHLRDVRILPRRAMMSIAATPG